MDETRVGVAPAARPLEGSAGLRDGLPLGIKSMRRKPFHEPQARSSGFGFASGSIACCMFLITTYLMVVGVDKPSPTRVYLASDVAGTQ